MSDGRTCSDRLRGFDDYSLSLGDELRGERATIGKSLLDVQHDLRIKAAYIAAIENCDPTVFPNQGFVAGYVRSYARYLKLNPDEMFARFCAESGFEGVNAGMNPSSKSRAIPKLNSLRNSDTGPRFPEYGLNQTERILNVISPSGIASAIVLTLLIGGMGFGGWTLLNDIQRVDFAPINQTPNAESVVASIQDAQEVTARPEFSESFGTESSSNTQVFGRLYRPQELAVPKLQPRDGPIAAIDPDTVGVLKPEPEIDVIPTISQAAEFASVGLQAEPVVTVEASAPKVKLYASRAAWVRVHYEDGTVLFEKILEKGEYYVLPEDAEPPLLRAGNSGSVYVVVDEQVFGPVGSGTSVAKQVSLAEADIRDNISVAASIVLAPEADSTVSTAEGQ